MKRLLSTALSILLILSFFSFSASADDPDYTKIAEATFAERSDEEVKYIMLLSLVELYNRGIVVESDVKNVIETLFVEKVDPVSDQMEYSFGQGTFIVGVDLKAGTYDITCEETDDDSYSESIEALGDLYSGLGLGEYADMIGALGGIANSTASMYVEITNTKGYREKFFDLKTGETARIILEDGMRLELTGGHAKLIFIR